MPYSLFALFSSLSGALPLSARELVHRRWSCRLLVKNRLRELRAEQFWSQGDLAARLRVSRQTVNAIETGRYDPSLPLAFRIARLFGRRIEDMFTPDDAS